jgi:Head domain of trimeric autotransporter adhesin
MIRHLLLLVTGLSASLSLFAQSGKVGINTTNPQAMLHVKDSNVLFSGAATLPPTPGNPPASGTGIRMMWYPDKAAFRVGRVSLANWDKDSIGIYSFASGLSSKASGDYSFASGYFSNASGNWSTAMGYTPMASGDYSFASGLSSKASGLRSTAMGNFTEALGDFSFASGDHSKASGLRSTAMGNSTEALGDFSFASGDDSKASGFKSTAMGNSTIASGVVSISMGAITSASGDFSTTMGLGTISRPISSLAIGRYNDSVITSSPTNWVATDPLFIIGNGTDNTSRKNAFVVYKNGNTFLEGELSRPSSGTDKNLVPICYGSVSGTAVINSGTSNFTATHPSTGQYDIDITGESYSSNDYTANVTVVSFSAPRMATTVASAGGILTVRIWDAAGVLVDGGFHFIVYKQ